MEEGSRNSRAILRSVSFGMCTFPVSSQIWRNKFSKVESCNGQEPILTLDQRGVEIQTYRSEDINFPVLRLNVGVSVGRSDNPQMHEFKCEFTNLQLSLLTYNPAFSFLNNSRTLSSHFFPSKPSLNSISSISLTFHVWGIDCGS